MEVIKTKDGIRYREMVWINGQAVKSPRFERKTDAKEWKALQAQSKRDAKFLGEDYKLNSKITFEEFADEWFVSKSQLANKTITLYTSILKNHLKPFLKNKKLKDIKRIDGEKLIHHLKAKGHNGKGINDIVGLLKSILIEAKKSGYILSNPLEYLSKVKINPHLEAYWTKAEINQFLLSNNFDSLYPFYLVALNTGMRKGELAGLCWDRVDFHLNQITISRTRDRDELKDTTKTNLKRVIPMNQIVKITLLNLMKKQLNPKFVFSESDRAPIDVNHVYRRFHQAQKKAGITNVIRFHDLRHTFASQFVMANGNIFDLQKILGHTKIDMTMRYSHYSPEHLQKAMKIISFGNTDDVTRSDEEFNLRVIEG
jgi:integrase